MIGTQAATGGAGRWNVALCFLAMLCEGIDLQSAGVAAAGIAQELQPTPEVLGLFFSASTLGLFIGAPVGGWIGDRKGRKCALIIALVLFGVFSFLTALCTTMDQLTIARFLTGLGLGGAMPNLIALTAESSAPEHRSRNVTLMYAGAPLGGALASVVSVIATAEHWRAVFIVGGIAPVIVAGIVAWRVFEPAWQPVVAGGHVPARPGVLAALAGEGRLVSTAFLWISFFFSLLLLYLLLNWLPLLLVDRGLTREQAAFTQILFNLGGTLGAAGIGFLLDRRGRTVTTAVTFACLAVLLLLLARTSTGLIMPLAFLLGTGILAAQAIVYALAPQCYPREVRGTGVGAAVGVGRLGSAVGPLFAAALLGSGQGGAQVLTGILPIVAVAGLCAVVLAARLPPTDASRE